MMPRHAPRLAALLPRPAGAMICAVATTIACVLICMLFSTAVWAANYEAGREAYINGDYRQALQIFTPLAKDGDAEAQKMLGIIYDYGHGVRVDQDKAMQWYLRAANQGHPAVQYQVGAKYFRGDGVGQDTEAAVRWWQLAANGGQAEAQFNLGLLYFRGLDVAQNDARAADLFRKAAEQGHGHAQYSLAVMYALGRGVEQDYAKALGWFEKSANQGIAQAQFNLGVFHENGYAAPQDPATARLWYERAAAQGLPQARDKLAALGLADGGPADALAGETVAENIAEEEAGLAAALAAEEISHPDEAQAEQLAESTAMYDPNAYDAGRPAVVPDAPAAVPQAAMQPGPIYKQAPPLATDRPAEQTLAAIDSNPGQANNQPSKLANSAGGSTPINNKRANERLKNMAWVKRQAAGHYTLQLGSVSQEKDIIRFINENNINAEATYIAININGQTRYNALYGVYASYDEAKQAIKTLPAPVQRDKPWVRNFGLLQKLLP